MDRFTTNSFKKQKGLYGILCLFMFLFSSTLVRAQTCNNAKVMTGTVTTTTGGLCVHQWGTPNNAGDNDLSTFASYQNAFGVTCEATMTLSGSTLYPAGVQVGLFMDNGGGTPFADFLGSLGNSVTIELLNGSTVVQTLSSSNGLVDASNFILEGLGGIGTNQGAMGGLATAAFNGIRFKTSSYISALNGMKIYGALIKGGCFQFTDCTAATVQATAPSGFVANGITNQTGTLNLPISVNDAGPVNVYITGGGFTAVTNPTIVNLTSGQNSISIPVRYDGSGTSGVHVITVTQRDVAGQDLTNGSCTVNATVIGKFAFNCSTSAASVTPNTFINNGTGQSASVTIPISNAVAGSTIQINLDNTNGLGNDFQGTYSTTLTAGQTQIVIPSASLTNFFDGTGAVGSRTLTFKSDDAANTCTASVSVANLFQFNCATTPAIINPSAFVSNGTAQTATVTLPISNANAGTAIINLDNTSGQGNDFQGTYTTTIAAGQTQIVIPVASLPNFFDGTGATGTRTLSFVSTAAANNCTAQVQVVSPLAVDTEQQILNLGGAPSYTGNTKTDANPHDGVVIVENSGQYNYYTVDCITGLSTAGTSTTPTSVLTSIAGTNPVTGQTYANNLSNLVHGTVVVNRTTGAYTYTKEVGTSASQSKFCVRIDDKNNASPSKVVEYTLNLGGTLTAVASPASINAGQTSTLTATGCSGTVTWTGGPSPLTGASVTVSPTATTTYTATCSTGGTATTTVTVTGGGGDLAVAFTTNPGSSFTQGSSNQYVVTVRNVGTSASQATTLTITSNISGFSVSGGGSQSIGVLQAGGQQTFSITVTGNNKGAGGALNAFVNASADSNSGNNAAAVSVKVAN